MKLRLQLSLRLTRAFITEEVDPLTVSFLVSFLTATTSFLKLAWKRRNPIYLTLACTSTLLQISNGAASHFEKSNSSEPQPSSVTSTPISQKRKPSSVTSTPISQKQKPSTSSQSKAKAKAKAKAPQQLPLSEQTVANLLRKAGLPENEVHLLTCTARFESGFNPRARNRNANGSQDSGLFQINDIWHRDCSTSRTGLMNPLVNARCAKIVARKQGLGAWMAFEEKEAICKRYRVGDFEKKGQKSIRSILEAHKEVEKGKRKKVNL